MSKFWDKVENCAHDSYPHYGVVLGCECGAYEYHCCKCGVYYTDCRCGEQYGLSGWSYKRWRSYYKRKGLE